MKPEITDACRDEMAAAIEELVERVRPLFAGHPPEVQGGALADLMATFLAGHQGEGKDQLRKEMMALHIETVWALVPVNEAIVLGERRSN